MNEYTNKTNKRTHTHKKKKKQQQQTNKRWNPWQTTEFLKGNRRWEPDTTTTLTYKHTHPCMCVCTKSVPLTAMNETHQSSTIHIYMCCCTDDSHQNTDSLQHAFFKICVLLPPFPPPSLGWIRNYILPFIVSPFLSFMSFGRSEPWSLFRFGFPLS